jgi:ubiquinone/menaquinone biosynthesis C-methylase UbiE
MSHSSILQSQNGHYCTCADIDAICEKDLDGDISVIPHKPGKRCFHLCNGCKLPCANNQMYGVYCIGVLGHISQFEDILAEIVRILRSGALLFLTVDWV